MNISIRKKHFLTVGSWCEIINILVFTPKLPWRNHEKRRRLSRNMSACALLNMSQRFKIRVLEGLKQKKKLWHITSWIRLSDKVYRKENLLKMLIIFFLQNLIENKAREKPNPSSIVETKSKKKEIYDYPFWIHRLFVDSTSPLTWPIADCIVNSKCNSFFTTFLTVFKSNYYVRQFMRSEHLFET